jgi:translation initiation factor 1 (eIF-1/SUI1)
MNNVNNSETILWAVKIGDPDTHEQIITTNPAMIEKASEWAKANGFHKLRIAKIDMNDKPDFIKTFANGGVVGQEITFDFQGDDKEGVIKEITDMGDFIVTTNDGRTVLAEERDVIKLGGMHKNESAPERKKRFGLFAAGGELGGESRELKGYRVDIFSSDYHSTLNLLNGKNSAILVTDGKTGDSSTVMSNEPYLKLITKERFNRSGTYMYAEPVNYGKEGDWRMFGGTFVWSSDSRFRDKVSEQPIQLHDRVEYAKGGLINMKYKIFEGYDHFNNKPLYKVTDNEDYEGEWHSSRADAKEELDSLINSEKMATGGPVDVFQVDQDLLYADFNKIRMSEYFQRNTYWGETYISIEGGYYEVKNGQQEKVGRYFTTQELADDFKKIEGRNYSYGIKKQIIDSEIEYDEYDGFDNPTQQVIFSLIPTKLLKPKQEEGLWSVLVHYEDMTNKESTKFWRKQFTIDANSREEAFAKALELFHAVKANKNRKIQLVNGFLLKPKKTENMATGGGVGKIESKVAIEFFTDNGIGEKYIINNNFAPTAFKKDMEQRLNKNYLESPSTIRIIKLWCREMGINPSKYVDGEIIETEDFIEDSTKRAKHLFNVLNKKMANGGAVGKNYYEQYGIGKSKYVVNYYDGEKKHKDGSEFYDIAIFKNKTALQKFLNKLNSEGYKRKMSGGGGFHTMPNGGIIEITKAINSTGQIKKGTKVLANYSVSTSGRGTMYQVRIDNNGFTFLSKEQLNNWANEYFSNDADKKMATGGGIDNANFKKMLSQAKKEILSDIKDGTISGPIDDFEDLHEYVFANCYGGLCEMSYEISENYEVENKLFDELDKWIKSGGLNQSNHSITKPNNRVAPNPKTALYSTKMNEKLTQKIIDVTYAFFLENGINYGQVMDLGTEITIDPSTVIPPGSSLKKGSMDGMQIIYDIKSKVYEVSEYMAGPNEDELYIFGQYKSLIPALKSLYKGNSNEGRQPIKKYKKGGKLTPAQQSKFGKVMSEFKDGELHSGSKTGPIVKKRDQAIAIALAEANASKKMATGGGVNQDIESTIITDEENAKLKEFIKHPIFNKFKEIDTFSSGGGYNHTMILLSNNHIVTINWESGDVQYSYFTYDNIEQYVDEPEDDERGWDNDFYRPEIIEGFPNYSDLEDKAFLDRMMTNKMATGGVVKMSVSKIDDMDFQSLSQIFESNDAMFSLDESEEYIFMDFDELPEGADKEDAMEIIGRYKVNKMAKGGGVKDLTEERKELLVELIDNDIIDEEHGYYNDVKSAIASNDSEQMREIIDELITSDLVDRDDWNYRTAKRLAKEQKSTGGRIASDYVYGRVFDYMIGGDRPKSFESLKRQVDAKAKSVNASVNQIYQDIENDTSGSEDYHYMKTGGGVVAKKDWTVVYAKGNQQKVMVIKGKDKDEAYREAEMSKSSNKLDSNWEMIEIYESKMSNGGKMTGWKHKK